MVKVDDGWPSTVSLAAKLLGRGEVEEHHVIDSQLTGDTTFGRLRSQTACCGQMSWISSATMEEV